MTHIETQGLRVAASLHAFVETEALPGSGLAADTFWSGFAALLRDLAPRNKALLAHRDALQAKIDAWHDGRAGKPWNQAELRGVSCARSATLLPEPGPFSVETSNVDAEIATTAGPQLVVPVMNARYALNAANARWGSLYDALYGTDAIPETDGAERGRGFNKIRGARVVARAKAFLDEAVPLAQGSHATVTGYTVVAGKLVAGGSTGLADPAQFVGYLGDAAAPHRDPAAPPRPAYRTGDRPQQPDRCRRPGGRVRRDPGIRHHHHHGLRGQRRRRGCGRQGGNLPQLARPDGRQPDRQLREGRQGRWNASSIRTAASPRRTAARSPCPAAA